VVADSKRCPRCEQAKALDAFGSPPNDCWCRDCRRDYMRGRKSDPEARRRNAKASAARHPERRKAREKVKDAIRRGDLPPARERACVDCGARAAAYDHRDHARPLDVESVCHECHGKRSRARGEHRRIEVSRAR
jgi:hypothetical protein